MRTTGSVYLSDDEMKVMEMYCNQTEEERQLMSTLMKELQGNKGLMTACLFLCGKKVKVEACK